MDLVFPHSVFDIAGLLHITPGAAELMQLHSNLPQVLQIKCLQKVKPNTEDAQDFVQS